tara:strand:+ start:374 stop:601 length:228 start_codon:yes stop_codon:yes gene_type:complete
MAFDEKKALRKALEEMTGVRNPDEAMKKRIEFNLKKLKQLELDQASLPSKKKKKAVTKKATTKRIKKSELRKRYA